MENEKDLTCGRCGRPLKTKKSREVGYGPICFLVKTAAEEVPKGQLMIDDNGEVVG